MLVFKQYNLYKIHGISKLERIFNIKMNICELYENTTYEIKSLCMHELWDLDSISQGYWGIAVLMCWLSDSILLIQSVQKEDYLLEV